MKNSRKHNRPTPSLAYLIHQGRCPTSFPIYYYDVGERTRTPLEPPTSPQRKKLQRASPPIGVTKPKHRAQQHKPQQPYVRTNESQSFPPCPSPLFFLRATATATAAVKALPMTPPLPKSLHSPCLSLQRASTQSNLIDLVFTYIHSPI